MRKSADLSGCCVRVISVTDVHDRKLALHLINRLYPHLPWSEEHFDWQFARGPCGQAKLRIVESGGSAVAMYAATRKRLSLNGGDTPAWMIQDVMTDPAFRGRGFLNHLAMLFMADMDSDRLCGYTFPNKLSENSFRRNGWTELMRVPLRTAKAQAATIAEPPRPVSTFEVETVEIWQAAGVGIGVVRDRDYLNWRYGRPDTEYFRFVLGDGDGVLVLKIFDAEERRILHICELFVREQSRQLLVERTLAFVHAFATANGADILTSWLPDGHPDLVHYSHAGFVRDDCNNRFIFVHGPAAMLSTICRAGSWHFSQGDSDVY